MAVHSRHVFFRRIDGKPGTEEATFDEVLEDFHRIKETRAGKEGAEYFSDIATVALHAQSVRALLDADIKVSMGEILRNVGRFPNYLTYPLPAQIAIFDRVFNRGLTNIIATSSFLDAIRSRNWKAAVQAANHSRVADKNSNRQAKVRDLFLNAARQEPFFVDPKCPPKSILHVHGAM